MSSSGPSSTQQLFGFSTHFVFSHVSYCFYGLFRIGELSTKSTRFACSVVQYRDLQILSREGDPCTAKITITDYKNNSDHRPFDILITRDDSVTFLFSSTARFEVTDPGPLFSVILIRPLLLRVGLIPMARFQGQN